MKRPKKPVSDQAALRASERRLRTIVEGMPVLMDAYDEHGQIVAWNAECERVTGYAATEIIGNPGAMEMLYPDADYRALMMAEAEARRREEYSSVWELTAKDGSLKTIEWLNIGARLKIPGWLEWSVGFDITERRRLERALRDATLREQQRLGRELHDGLGQELTGLSMLATGLARDRSGSDPVLAGELERLAEIASQAIITCKEIARGLAPVGGSKEDLAAALRELAAGLGSRAPLVKVSYAEESSAPIRTPDESCNHLFRIVQEAVSNALKHAGARAIHIQLMVDPSTVVVEVTDDGRGMEPRMTSPAGMGLRTMRDRATAIGARLTVTAAGQGGTVVRCQCPNGNLARQRSPRQRGRRKAAPRR
jgi:PAS domain S-box-containing protein